MDTHLIPALTLNYLLRCYIAALLVMGMIWPSLLPPHVTLAPLNQARVRNSLKPCPGARESGMPSLAGVILPAESPVSELRICCRVTRGRPFEARRKSVWRGRAPVCAAARVEALAIPTPP